LTGVNPALAPDLLPGSFNRAVLIVIPVSRYCQGMELQQAQPQAPSPARQKDYDSEMRNIIEEARVILPGVQALFGFQTIAVFNERFGDLETFAKVCHLLGLAMVVLTIAAIMTPAIYYRACAGNATRHMAKVSATLIHVGVLPLALGIALDMFTVLFVVTENAEVSALASAGTLLVFFLLWHVLPAYGRKHYQPR
jgi:hypothetical protein